MKRTYSPLRMTFIVIIALILIGLLLECAYSVWKKYTFDHIYTDYQETFSRDYPEYLKQQYASNDFFSIFAGVRDCRLIVEEEKPSARQSYYLFTETYNITITVDDVFDTYSDDNKYDFLDRALSNARIAVNNLKDTQGIGAYDLSGLSNIYDDMIFFDRNFNLTVRTSQNRYEPIRFSYDCFTMNGDVVRINPSQSSSSEESSSSLKASSAAGKSSAAGSARTHRSASRSDAYDVDDYDDPEDFYEDHEDEFEDFYDAEDYYDENHD